MVGIIGRIACGIATIAVSGGAFAQQPPGGTTAGPATAGVGAAVGKIGIGTVGPPNLPADLRIKLEDAAAAGLVASGAQVVSAAVLSRARATAALGSCGDPVCERRLAQITDTRYWLRGTCQLDTSTYRLHLELVDAQSGAVVAARDDTCDICTEADAADLANVAASSLKAALTRSQVSAGPPVSAAPPPTNVTAPPYLDGSGARTDGDERPLWRRMLPWAAFVGAAAAVAGGTYALTLDDGDCFGNCKTVWSDPAWRLGVPLIGIGAALATTGVILLRKPAGASAGSNAEPRGTPATVAASTQIIVSLGRVAIAGRF